jgi:DNA-binding LacI/PurR family transcriptional regulator
MAATLKQIAEKAGVSVPTVSRILNGRETGVKVREETRQRVLAAAAELNYRPNLLARGLVGSKSSLIGVIVRDIADPFLNTVLNGMYDAAIEHQYRLFLGHVGQQADTTLDYGSMFEQSHADGIIVMGDMQDDAEALEVLTSQHEHVVGVTDRTGRRQFPGVYADSERGATLAMEHLLQLGHQRIICVTDPIISDGRLRAAVYEQLMRDHGLENQVQIYKVTRSMESGYLLGQKLFAEPLLYTAIFAATDSLAIGLMKAAYEQRVTIPEGVSIIGYDDIDMALYTTPALTTVSQSGHEMGYCTTTLLIDMIENERDSAEVEDVLLEPMLRIRESTGTPAV